MKTYIGWRDQAQRLRVTIIDHDNSRHELKPGYSQKAWNHSPDGFECGYGGSGPAQLALALLLDHGIGKETAIRFHQEFKWALIARLPRDDSWEVTGQEIQLWTEDTETQEALWAGKFDGAKAAHP